MIKIFTAALLSTALVAGTAFAQTSTTAPAAPSATQAPAAAHPAAKSIAPAAPAHSSESVKEGKSTAKDVQTECRDEAHGKDMKDVKSVQADKDGHKIMSKDCIKKN
jgi:hypothetical protein